MAVTKIRRTSSITLLIAFAISLVVFALFFFGGQVSEEQKLVADMSQPKFTDMLLYWAYAILAITIVVLILFAIFGFFKSLKESPKKALGGLFVMLALVALLVVTFVIGDGTLLNIPGYDGSDNNPTTLKLTDMWLFSSYIMLVITIGAIFLTPLFKKKG